MNACEFGHIEKERQPIRNMAEIKKAKSDELVMN